MLWVSLVAEAAIWGSYLFDIGLLLAHGKVDVGQATGGFIKSVVLLITVEVIAAIVLAIIDPKDADAPADFRDREFAASAAVPAYTLLSASIVVVMLLTPIIIAAAPRFVSGDPAMVSAIVLCNAMLLALVLAHLLHCGMQLVRYRREG